MNVRAVNRRERGRAPDTSVDPFAPQGPDEWQRAVDAPSPEHVSVEELLGMVRQQPPLALAVADLLPPVRRRPSSGGDARPGRPPRSRSSSRAPAAASRHPHRRRLACRSGLKPPMARSAPRRNAMLQPGTCSAMRSSSSTWVGPPGARAMHCATAGSSAGTTFGPPEPTTFERRNGCTRKVSQSRSTRVSASVYATMSPLACARPTFLAALRPPFGNVDDGDSRMRAANLARPVSRAVVHEDDFEVRIDQLLERSEVVLERVGGVVGAHDHRDLRPPGPLRRGKWRVGECPGYGSCGRFRVAGAVDEPEVPVLDIEPATPPLVGPRECHCAAGPFLEGHAQVHRRDRSLALLAFADAVGASLGQQQRPGAGNVLQSRQVGSQVRFAVQVHVEGADVEEREVEELGRAGS